jgi:hypothetical protein
MSAENMNLHPSEQTSKQRISDQIEQTMHRLLSLEISLGSLSKSNRLGIKATEARIKAVRSLQMELHRAQHLIGQQKLEVSNVPLEQLVPQLSQCTPIEHQVYQSFSTERQRLLDALAQQAMRLRTWIRTSRVGFWPSLRATMRLSKVARLIAAADRWIRNVEIESSRVDQLIRKAVHQLHPPTEKDPAPSTVEGLVRIFEDLDSASNEIATLREKIRSEEQMIIRMRAWLHQEENLLRPQPVPAPKIEELDRTSDFVAEHHFDPIQRTKHRLVLARRFIEKFETPRPVVESFLSQKTNKPLKSMRQSHNAKARTG